MQFFHFGSSASPVFAEVIDWKEKAACNYSRDENYRCIHFNNF
jgi:hypothetical protein